MGVGLNHGGYRGTSPPEFGVGDANANCSPRFCHVSKFQTSDCLNYNVVMQKKAYRPNPIILTEYSLFPKSTSSTSTKSPHRADNSTFFRQRHGQKSTTQNAPKHAISSENSFFLAPSPVGRGTPPHTPTFCIPPASPRIQARFTTLHCGWQNIIVQRSGEVTTVKSQMVPVC